MTQSDKQSRRLRLHFCWKAKSDRVSMLLSFEISQLAVVEAEDLNSTNKTFIVLSPLLRGSLFGEGLDTTDISDLAPHST